jgi:hypothetical protein
VVSNNRDLKWVLYTRYPDLVTGHAAAVDVFFFAIWIALMLVPLFQEVSFLGVKFKREVEGLKAFVATQVGDMRNELGMPSTSRRRSVPT